VAALDRPILVIEDDETIRRALQMALESFGFPVVPAANGQEGLDAIGRKLPSLVLLDMKMPVMDGWQFCEALPSRGFDPPVVVMTTRVDAARTAEELGVAGYLPKPFDLQELLAVVHQHRIP